MIGKKNNVGKVDLDRLPAEATVLHRGATEEDFLTPEANQAVAEANVFLVCGGEIFSHTGQVTI